MSNGAFSFLLNTEMFTHWIYVVAMHETQAYIVMDAMFASPGDKEYLVIPIHHRPNFMAMLTAEFCAYSHHSPLLCKRRISALSVSKA